MPPKKAKPQQNDSLVVGLGASAGGLEPLKAFISSLPEKTEMAFIVILHLSPEHDSNMAELLQSQTAMTVEQVQDKTEIKTEHIYIIPPDKHLKVGDNHLELSEFERDHKPQSVDLFFRSLGESKGIGSACVILSGSGSDGAVGMKTVKENGGLTIAQDPSEAQYPGMPQSAIDTGLIDKVLPVGAIANELLDYKRNLDDGNIDGDPEKLSDADRQALGDITDKLRQETDHDFTNYKKSTMLRRIERRTHVTRQETLSDYRDYLKEDAEEVQKLFKDMLISVTNFFRNPEAFDALKEKVIPKLFRKLGEDEQLRIWVPGCATGEEAYSIAMLLHEYADETDDSSDLQIFATDIDEAALKLAREAEYPTSIASDVSEERLERFFNKKDDKYHVKQELRKMILFAKHNMLSSPPFSKLHMISCRNLLIYLNRELQGEVFNLFHYALNSEGYLFLGKSDSNLEATELFTPYDKQHNIYRQSSKAQSTLPLPEFPLHIDENQLSASHSWRVSSRKKQNFEKLHRRLMRRQFVPPSVIINENKEVVHATDGIDAYLKYRGGNRAVISLRWPSPNCAARYAACCIKPQGTRRNCRSKRIHSSVPTKGPSLLRSTCLKSPKMITPTT